MYSTIYLLFSNNTSSESFDIQKIYPSFIQYLDLTCLLENI